MKNRKEQRQERRRQREAQVVPPVRFETQEEADSALVDAARIINLKERQDRMNKKSRVAGLPALPRMPKKSKDKPLHPCACGCETPTRAQFAPGHDSYIRGWALRVERDIVKMKDTPEAQRPAIKAMLAERARKAKAVAEAENDTEEVETDDTGTEQ